MDAGQDVVGSTPVFSETQPSAVATDQVSSPPPPPQTPAESSIGATPSVLDPVVGAPDLAAPSNIVTNPDAPKTTPGGGQKSSGNSKKIIAGALVLLMLFGVGAGVFALRNQQTSQSLAWNCSLYTFNVSESGEVTVLNGSGKAEVAQQVNVQIDGNLAGTFDVPALNSGEGASLGSVTVPNNGFSWNAQGTVDCDDSGNYEGQPDLAQCLNLRVYDTGWNLLSSDDLKLLSSGDVVRISVAGSATSGSFEAARFTINGELQDEVTDKKPGTEEFYQEYEIPSGEDSFTFMAELKHSVAGWF